MLIDSNIIIYASKPGNEFLHALLARTDIAVSIVNYVETLGYHLLTDVEKRYLTEFFSNTDILPLTSSVADRAIALRQARRLKLGDALIAATALVHDLTLVTRNTPDFDGISGLSLLDPFVHPLTS